MSRELLQQALQHLVDLADDLRRIPSDIAQTIAALEAELAKPEQEPVAWQNLELPMEFYEYEHLDPMWHHHYRPLYTAPPRKEWVGLTAEEIFEITERLTKEGGVNCDGWIVAVEVQQKLKELNT